MMAYIDKVGAKAVEAVATDGERGVRIQVSREAFDHFGEARALDQARRRWERVFGAPVAPPVTEAVTPPVTANARG